MKIIEEFKAFAMRGNVFDLAVGVIVGAAFGKIVSALTSNVLMPVLGAVTGSVDFSKLAWHIESPVEKKQIAIGYGVFLDAVVQFILLAVCVFLLVKGMNLLVGKKEAAPAPSNEEKLLVEIRDLLKSRPPGTTP
ncbi:MAG: large-conductance mechanosensitive channel protein MscL [Verrucomicrobia bacterium]|nr:large-conductance mechanosensitive channel protein MscL [Verrucomicrobiota bacterium]MDE3100049.1 large-conductance mechanosensitive channel protein MscL [Verrucomicrobiota bacterium]